MDFNLQCLRVKLVLLQSIADLFDAYLCPMVSSVRRQDYEALIFFG